MAEVNWKVAANRRVVGDWVEVKSLDGIAAKVKPRKYSQTGTDEINATALRAQAALKRETVHALLARGKSASEAENFDALKGDVLLDVLGTADPELFKQATVMALHLRYGIAEYQFGDESGKPTDEWITDVLDDTELTAELFAIVKEFNSPLPEATSDNSETSLNGNSGE